MLKTILDKINSTAIRVVIVILIATLVTITLSRESSLSLEIPVHSGKIISLENLEGPVLLGQLQALPTGSVLKLQWETKEKEFLWQGNKESGSIYSASYFDGLDKPFLIEVSQTLGVPDLDFIKENSTLKGTYYLRLASRPEIPHMPPEQNADSQPSDHLSLQILAKKYDKLIDIFKNSLKIELEPGYFFQVVTFGQPGRSQVSVAERESKSLLYIATLAVILFLGFFIKALFRPSKPKTLRRYKKST